LKTAAACEKIRLKQVPPENDGGVQRGTPKRRKNQVKRSIVLSLILAICCLLPFTASAEEWSDFFALNEETAIGYDEALASYQDTPNAPAGTRIELLPSAAILSGDAVLAQEAIITGDGESTSTVEDFESLKLMRLLRFPVSSRSDAHFLSFCLPISTASFLATRFRAFVRYAFYSAQKAAGPVPADCAEF
jgi:hypothetical protein